MPPKPTETKTISKAEFLQNLDTAVAIGRAKQNPLNRLAEEIKYSLDTINESIVEIGQKLIEAKSLCKHGEWEKWLESNFEWSDRTAQNFMNVAKQFGDGKSEDIFAFDKWALFALAQPSTPEPVREQALAIAAAGEKVTHKRAKSLIKDHKAVKERASLPPAPPAPKKPEPEAKKYVKRNTYEYASYLGHLDRIKKTVPNSPEHAEELNQQRYALNRWYHYNIGEPWPTYDHDGNLMPPTNPDPVPLPPEAIAFLERQAKEAAAKSAPPVIIDVPAEPVETVKETATEPVAQAVQEPVAIEEPAPAEAPEAAPAPTVFDSAKKRRLNELMEKLDELETSFMTPDQFKRHTAILTQFEAYDAANANDARWLGLLELVEALYAEVASQLPEGPLPEWGVKGEWFVTLVTGEKVMVSYTPDEHPLQTGGHLDHFEFRGEISETGYRSHFENRNLVYSPFEVSKTLAEELRAAFLKKCSSANVIKGLRSELKDKEALLNACKKRYQELETERDQFRQDCDTLTAEQVHIIEILVNRFDWTPEQMTDLEHAMQEHFPGWESCKYL
jgi:hypothetical protein